MQGTKQLATPPVSTLLLKRLSVRSCANIKGCLHSHLQSLGLSPELLRPPEPETPERVKWSPLSRPLDVGLLLVGRTVFSLAELVLVTIDSSLLAVELMVLEGCSPVSVRVAPLD